MTKSETNKLDKMFSEKVRSIGYCEKCGGTNWLQNCHIYSRKYRQIRWDSLNTFCLCAKCHRWGHDCPTEFAEWVKTKRTEKELEELNIRRHQVGKVFYEDVLKQIGG